MAMKHPQLIAVLVQAALVLSLLAACADSQRWQMFFDAGNKYRETNLIEATRAYRSAVLEASLPGATDDQLTRALDALGAVYLERKQYSNAEDVLKRSLAVHDKSGQEDEASLQCVADLSRAYIKQDKFKEAVPLGERTLSYDRRQVAPFNKNLLTDLEFCAYVDWKTGNFTEAEKLLNEALQICQKKPFPGNADELTRTMLDQAEMYTAKGDYAKAEPIFKRALYLREETFYPKEYWITEILSNYSDMLAKAGRRPEADHVRSRLVSIIEAKENGAWVPDPEGKDVMKYYKPGPHDPMPGPTGPLPPLEP